MITFYSSYCSFSLTDRLVSGCLCPCALLCIPPSSPYPTELRYYKILYHTVLRSQRNVGVLAMTLGICSWTLFYTSRDGYLSV